MTSQFTDEQVEAARRARNSHDFVGHGKCRCGSGGFTSIGHGQHQARAALEAAAGTAPQAESGDRVREVIEAHSVPHYHRDYGHGLFTTDLAEIAEALAAPLQPQSTVDVASLIREAKAEALEEFAGQMATGFNPQTLNAERRAIKREARTRAAEYREGSET